MLFHPNVKAERASGELTNRDGLTAFIEAQDANLSFAQAKPGAFEDVAAVRNERDVAFVA